jgi:hypothetical protein
VFYNQKGKLKVAVVSDRDKDAVATILGPDELLGKSASRARYCAWRQFWL